MEVEGHPIPQDITGFQFKLIGNMTVKQFAYLGIGIVLAWIFFALNIPLIIKAPIAAACAITGIFFAFAPVRGRAADTMLSLFFKALFRPNQYTYQPKNSEAATTLPPIEQVQQKQSVASEEPTQTAQEIEIAPAQAKAEITDNTGTAQEQETHEKVLTLEEQLQHALAQKEALEKNVITLNQQLTQKPEEVFAPSELKETTSVKTVPPPLKKTVGAPLIPDAPNLITGIIKDARGNELPNILVEIKDANNNAVRAFKTNQLGQFASATSLGNGTYTVVFEDPKKQHRFTPIAIHATGTVIAPLEVTSVDEREELRKSLFQT